MHLAVWVMIFINVLANFLPLNGITTAEVSARLPSFFVPAGYVFSIWAVIYIIQIAFTALVLWQREKYEQYINKLFPWFMLLQLLNVVWVFLWHYQIFWGTIVVILGMLGTLCYLYWLTANEKNIQSWFLNACGIYLAWVSVATIANISGVLAQYIPVDSLVGQLFSALMIQIAALLAVVIMFRHKDIAFVMVILWAIIGIAVNFPTITVLTYSVILACAFIAIGTLAIFYRFLRQGTILK